MASRGEIRKAAEQFRTEHWLAGSIPVNVELIAEKAGIDIVPAANLRNDVGMDACISANLQYLYVDLGYLTDPRMEFRVRFSVAHELGHLVLHKRVFNAHTDKDPQTVSQWARHVQDRIETSMLESEANEFAGCLLVPEPELRSLYEEHHPRMREAFENKGWNLDATDPERIRAYLASHIHKKFEVSAKVIEIKLWSYGIVPNH